jgi:signal transduction histidine kinase/CheY-like chemotaxis protein
MKQVNTFASICLVFLMLLNVFSFLNINQRFISFLNSSLEQQTTLCGEYMEKQLTGFQNDIGKLLYDYNFSNIFKDQSELDRIKQNIQVFYSKYRDLVTNVFVFDNNKNYFGLYFNELEDDFVTDNFPKQRQQELVPRDRVEEKGGKYLYQYPYFENDQVSGNVIVEVDLQKFANRIFSFYPIGRTISWQWVVNSRGEIVTDDFENDFEIESIQQIADSIDMFSAGLIKHFVTDSVGNRQKVHSAFYPLTLFNQNLGIVFSTSQAEFNKFFINQNKLVSLFTFIITLALIFYLLIVNRRREKIQERLMMSETIFRQVIEKFPTGIMILDSGDIIRNINAAAQRMLFVSDRENLIGQDFSKLFLISNKYLLTEDFDPQDTSDYLYYEKEGIETVIFRQEERTSIGGEELRLIALIDVSSLERSRKQEVAANRTKSEFLASMSHEIRTPMNGILGMVASLLGDQLPEEAKEKVHIIKKSSDLLMTIISDILDLSKVEAGKMMLEEIPFRLREEVTFVMDLFKPLAEEKGLKIDSSISTKVPDKLIGDPFRLRQVISNLLSNAIKFTGKGRIEIGADVMENVKGRMQLLFWVEDTGIGIPEEKIESIFSIYNQSSGSVSRKFGGTGLGTSISKQLVELMNGEIWAESPSRISGTDDAPGSRFSFTVEVYSNEKLSKKYNYQGIQQLSQITVLFLTKESDPEKNNISKLLHKFGVNIVTKIYQDITIDVVVHHLSSKREMYHLVIVADRKNQEGFTLVGKLKEEGLTDKLPCIMVCNNDLPGNYKRSKKLGIDYYVIEPFESLEVYNIISEIFPQLTDHKSLTQTLNTLPSQLSILLVEDNSINQKVAKSIFKNIGYEIELAANGTEAIQKAANHTYDIIFMDLFMPEMDGFEATEHLRRAGVKAPIIAMSADSDDERKAKSVLAGMDEYLPKPAKVETVKRLLIKLFSTPVN